MKINKILIEMFKFLNGVYLFDNVGGQKAVTQCIACGLQVCWEFVPVSDGFWGKKFDVDFFNSAWQEYWHFWRKFSFSKLLIL